MDINKKKEPHSHPHDGELPHQSVEGKRGFRKLRRNGCGDQDNRKRWVPPSFRPPHPAHGRPDGLSQSRCILQDRNWAIGGAVATTSGSQT